MTTTADLIDTNDEHLLCLRCGATFSANKPDYFWRAPDELFEHCGEPMQLVTRRVVYEPVKR